MGSRLTAKGTGFLSEQDDNVKLTEAMIAGTYEYTNHSEFITFSG
jgi:hypothetical protein